MSQQDGRKTKDMRLKIIDCRQVYSSRNQRGDPYTIFEIDAARAEDGQRINQKLRSFSALPIGEVVEVTVTPFVSERHGKSFTLHLKDRERSGGGGSTARTNELSQEVADLRNRVASLSQRVLALETILREKGIAAPPQAQAQAQPAASQLDERFGAEAPW